MIHALAESIPPVRMAFDEVYPEAEEVNKLAPKVDAVLLSQFSMATALDHVTSDCPVPVLSPPHSSARRLKELLSAGGA